MYVLLLSAAVEISFNKAMVNDLGRNVFFFFGGRPFPNQRSSRIQYNAPVCIRSSVGIQWTVAVVIEVAIFLAWRCVSLVDFSRAHTNYSLFGDVESEFSAISASIIQGAAAGPASYVVTWSDLRPLTPGNSMVEFPDDTFLVIPSSNHGSWRAVEVQHVACRRLGQRK